jgi:hypothetical protein
MAETTKVGKVNHIVTVNKVKIVIEEYASTYTNIGDIVGIKLMADADKADDYGSVPGLKRRAKIITFSVATKDKKRFTVQCSIDKASTAPAALIGKNIGSSPIKSVSIRRRRTRR